MAKLTPQERAEENALTKRLTLKMIAADPEIAAAESQIGQRRALDSSKHRHVAAMADFTSGNATLRAVEAFKVKATVASVARAQGLQPNGTAVPAPKLPAPDNEASDAETESASA